MGVDTLRQSLLLSKPQTNFERCHTPKTVLMATKLHVAWRLFSFSKLHWRSLALFISTAQWFTLRVRLTLLQPTFRFASSTYPSLTWDGAFAVDWEKQKFKTCLLDDYSMVYLSNTVYVLISHDHDGDDLLVFLLRAWISAMSMIFQSRWLIWLLFFVFSIVDLYCPWGVFSFVSTALLDVEAQVPPLGHKPKDVLWRKE